MRVVTIAKKVKDIQLGHLYEHLYCDALAHEFRSRGLFAYLDYHVDGKTYYRGMVVIRVELYTQEAVDREHIVYDTKAAVEDDTIAGRLLQIMAEKQMGVENYDDTKAKRRLQQLNDMQWLSVDDAACEPMVANRTTKPAFTLAARNRRNFGTIMQTIHIDKAYVDSEPAAILPLFVVLSKTIRSNLQEDLCASLQCYSCDDWFTKVADGYTDTNEYRVSRRQSTELSIEEEVTAALFRTMKQHDFVRRFAEHFRTLDPQQTLTYPNIDEMIEKTDMFVGTQAWRQYATEDRIRDILAHTSIEFQYRTRAQAKPETTPAS